MQRMTLVICALSAFLLTIIISEKARANPRMFNQRALCQLGIVCNQQVLCQLDLDCEILVGSTCLKAGGLESCFFDPERPRGDQLFTGIECAKKFSGALTVCIIPTGDCGGPQCIEDTDNVCQ